MREQRGGKQGCCGAVWITLILSSKARWNHFKPGTVSLVVKAAGRERGDESGEDTAHRINGDIYSQLLSSSIHLLREKKTPLCVVLELSVNEIVLKFRSCVFMSRHSCRNALKVNERADQTRFCGRLYGLFYFSLRLNMTCLLNAATGPQPSCHR